MDLSSILLPSSPTTKRKEGVGRENKDQRVKMKKAELIFIPVLRISHLVSTLEFAKCLIDHDDRLFITILSMKFPLNTAITDDQSLLHNLEYKL